MILQKENLYNPKSNCLQNRHFAALNVKYFLRFMVIFCLFVEAVKSSKHIGLRIPLLQSYALKLVYLLDSECPYDVFSQWFSFYQGHLNVSINLRLIGPVTHTLHLEHTISTYKVNLNMFYRAVVIMK